MTDVPVIEKPVRWFDLITLFYTNVIYWARESGSLSRMLMKFNEYVQYVYFHKRIYDHLSDILKVSFKQSVRLWHKICADEYVLCEVETMKSFYIVL